MISWCGIFLFLSPYLCPHLFNICLLLVDIIKISRSSISADNQMIGIFVNNLYILCYIAMNCIDVMVCPTIYFLELYADYGPYIDAYTLSCQKSVFL